MLPSLILDSELTEMAIVHKVNIAVFYTYQRGVQFQLACALLMCEISW